jgi:serine/threonine protein kinase
MLLGVKYLHDRNILHRDLSINNVFLTKDGDVKIGDFGSAKFMTRKNYKTITGTAHYMSPEILNNQPYNRKTDIFSLGVIFY